jgi:amidohydrolase
MTIVELAAKHKQHVIDLRRDFHSYPELGRNEIHTSQKVAEALQNLGLEIKLNTETHSVIGMLRGGQPGKTVALRADMDALPLQEDTGLPFASRNPGVMHACGHDGHTAMALGAAAVLSEIRDTLRGNVKFLFQPAEELAPEGGAKRMIEEGALEGVDAIFGLHVWPSLKVGKIGFSRGALMASSDPFTVKIQGKASHASQPQNGIDATLVASQLVCALQGIVSRRVDPQDAAVITIGEFHSGTTYNIMSGEAHLRGTVRSLSREVRDHMEGYISSMVEGVCRAYGAKGILSYEYGYPTLINDPDMVELAQTSAVSRLGEACVLTVEKAALGGEDFARYLEKIPGAFLWLGCTPADADTFYPIHNPKFFLDEQCLELGVVTLAGIAQDFLNGQQLPDCN